MGENMENKALLLEAAREMESISEQYCIKTECNDVRMKSAGALNNCKWYHGAWMYCRLAEVVVSNDYLGELYAAFFEKNKNKDCIRILICGLADFAILDHVLTRIPCYLANKVFITIVDICYSPLALCDWFIHQPINNYSCFQSNIEYCKSDATKLPFKNNTFDLITNYSFLTRMVTNEMQKTIAEWSRVLKQNGEIYTTIRINPDKTLREGDFNRNNTGIEFAMDKVNNTIEQLSLNESDAEKMKKKVRFYLQNIMSVAIPSIETIERLFSNYELKYSYEDQQGELEKIHRMVILQAKKKERMDP